jgi:hypothetical protein
LTSAGISSGADNIRMPIFDALAPDQIVSALPIGSRTRAAVAG